MVTTADDRAGKTMGNQTIVMVVVAKKGVFAVGRAEAITARAVSRLVTRVIKAIGRTAAFGL